MKAGHRRPHAAAVVAVMLLAGLCRLHGFETTRLDGEWLLRDGDSLYHLRRVEQTIDSGRIPEFDSQLSFPQGQLVQWPPGYDLGLAGLAVVVCGTSPERSCLTTTAVLSTPLLGVLTTVLVLLLGRALIDRWAAVLGAAMFAAYPIAVSSAQIGSVDHHALEPLLVALWFLVLARNRPLAAGSIAGASLGVFPTALLGVSATLLALCTIAAAKLRRARAVSVACVEFAIGAAAVGLVVVLAGPFRASWTPASPSRFHLVVLATFFVASVAIAVCVRLWPNRRYPRVLGGAIAAVVGTAVAWPALPLLMRMATGGGFWQEVTQHQPVARDWLTAALLASILTAVCVVALATAVRRGSDVLAAVSLAGWLLGCAGLAQMRYLMAASSLLAIVAAESLSSIRGRLLRYGSGLFYAGTIALGLSLLLPLADYLRPRTLDAVKVDVVRLLKRLAKYNKETGVSVLVDWPWGHHVLYHAQLPTVASPFILEGNDVANATVRAALLTNSTDVLLQTMIARRSRYLLVPRAERQLMRKLNNSRRLRVIDREGKALLFALCFP